MLIIFHLASTVKKLVNTACISACNFVSAFGFAQGKEKSFGAQVNFWVH